MDVGLAICVSPQFYIGRAKETGFSYIIGLNPWLSFSSRIFSSGHREVVISSVSLLRYSFRVIARGSPHQAWRWVEELVR